MKIGKFSHFPSHRTWIWKYETKKSYAHNLYFDGFVLTFLGQKKIFESIKIAYT